MSDEQNGYCLILKTVKLTQKHATGKKTHASIFMIKHEAYDKHQLNSSSKCYFHLNFIPNKPTLTPPPPRSLWT